MSKQTFCSACGRSWWRAALMAMAVDLGARTNDPNYCHATDDHEHIWNDIRETASEVDSDAEGERDE